MSEADSCPPHSLLILAGGQGRRMQGKDKGLLEWQGRPLIAHIVDAIASSASEVLISCNRNTERYGEFGHPLSDTLPDFPGPLAGVLSGLEAAACKQVLVVPCDNPTPPFDLYQRLCMRGDQGIRFAFDGEREQYLYALIPRTEKESLRDYLASGQRSVKGWFAECCAESVDFSDQRTRFCNINRHSDELARHT